MHDWLRRININVLKVSTARKVVTDQFLYVYSIKDLPPIPSILFVDHALCAFWLLI